MAVCPVAASTWWQVSQRAQEVMRHAREQRAIGRYARSSYRRVETNDLRPTLAYHLIFVPCRDLTAVGLANQGTLATRQGAAKLKETAGTQS